MLDAAQTVVDEQKALLAWLYDRNALHNYRIRQVAIDGARNTNRSVFGYHIGPCMKADTLADIVNELRLAALRLRQLGIFEDVEVVLDTPVVSFSGVDDTRLIDVTLRVKERGRILLKTGTAMGNDDGNITAVVNVRNVLGGAETLHTAVSYGYRTSAAFDCKFSKPINANPDTLLQLSADSAHRNNQLASSFDELTRSLSARFLTISRLGVHTLSLESAWRQICNISDNASLSVRHEAGHSLKCSISHILERDRRDDRLLPMCGYYLKLTNELAGLYGDVKHLKNDAEAQLNIPLGAGFSLSTTLRAGILKSLDGTMPRISDRFFAGGPTSVRGFRWNGLGPMDKPDHLGGDAHYQLGVSLYTPIPILSDKTWLRGHIFVNAGNLIQMDQGLLQSQSLPLLSKLQQTSVTMGMGLVVRHQICRLELNWTLPLAVREGDAFVKGFGFGVGTSDSWRTHPNDNQCAFQPSHNRQKSGRVSRGGDHYQNAGNKYTSQGGHPQLWMCACGKNNYMNKSACRQCKSLKQTSESSQGGNTPTNNVPNHSKEDYAKVSNIDSTSSNVPKSSTHAPDISNNIVTEPIRSFYPSLWGYPFVYYSSTGYPCEVICPQLKENGNDPHRLLSFSFDPMQSLIYQYPQHFYQGHHGIRPNDRVLVDQLHTTSSNSNEVHSNTQVKHVDNASLSTPQANAVNNKNTVQSPQVDDSDSKSSQLVGNDATKTKNNGRKCVCGSTIQSYHKSCYPCYKARFGGIENYNRNGYENGHKHTKSNNSNDTRINNQRTMGHSQRNTKTCNKCGVSNPARYHTCRECGGALNYNINRQDENSTRSNVSANSTHNVASEDMLVKATEELSLGKQEDRSKRSTDRPKTSMVVANRLISAQLGIKIPTKEQGETEPRANKPQQHLKSMPKNNSALPTTESAKEGSNSSALEKNKGKESANKPQEHGKENNTVQQNNEDDDDNSDDQQGWGVGEF